MFTVGGGDKRRANILKGVKHAIERQSKIMIEKKHLELFTCAHVAIGAVHMGLHSHWGCWHVPTYPLRLLIGHGERPTSGG